MVWTLPFPVSKELLFLRSSRVWGGVRAFPAKTSFEPIAQLNRSGQCLSGSGLGCRQGFHRILGLGLVFGLDLTFGVRFRVLVLSRACVRSTCQLTNAIKGGKNGAFSITQSEVESLVEILDFGFLCCSSGQLERFGYGPAQDSGSSRYLTRTKKRRDTSINEIKTTKTIGHSCLSHASCLMPHKT